MSSSPGKQAPLKPPRVRKTLSVPCGDNTSFLQKNSSHKQFPSSSDSQRPSDKVTINSSQAAANLINVLKKASEREKANLGKESSVDVQDFSTSSDPQDNEKRTSPTPSGPKKTPLLPPSVAVPSKPKPPPIICNTLQVDEKTDEPEVSDDNDDIFDRASPSPRPASRSPNSKKALLPPGKPLNTSMLIPNNSHTPSQPQKRLCRSESHDVSPPISHKPLPLPRTRSHDNHVIAPEEPSKPPLDISSSESTASEEEAMLVQCNIEPNFIPISPSSTSSGIPEDPIVDNPSPYFTESRGTTPSCITTNELCSDDITKDSPSSPNQSKEETDGGAVSKPVNHTQPKKPARPQRRVQLKDETSWIKKKQSDKPSPPSSPPAQSLSSSTSTPDTQTSSPKTVRPYRTIAILPEKQFSSSSLLQDTSKPVIGPHGQYYPPAVRMKSPDPRELVMTSNNPLRKTQSNELINVVNKKETSSSEEHQKVPQRFKKTRRSNSFRENTVRPASMITTDMLAGEKAKEQLFASTTIGRTMTESAKEEMLQQDKKAKSSGRKGVLKLFGRGKVTESKCPEEEMGSSSDDEVGGTIKRMPRQQFIRKPWETQVSDPGDADEYVSEYNQLFEYVFVLGLKEDRKTKKLSTETTYRYPPASSGLSQDDAMRSVDQFCFPDIESWKPVLTYRSETYSFVLTSMDGSRRFGYCRRLLPEGKEARLPEVYCIISPLGCFDLYSKLLDHIEQRRAVSKAAVYSFLSSIIANPFPAPGRTVPIRVLPAKGGDLEIVELKRPHDSRLEHVDFAELYNTLGPKMLIQVFSSLLMERRVILSAQRLSTLSSCCHALLALLYPFEWQHTFIPVLPHSLIDFCGSPLPFIIGISPVMAKQLDKLDIEMEEALVVDLDKKRFIKKFGDESSILPNKVSQFLVHKLEARVISNEYSKHPDQRSGQTKADQMVVLSFMTIFAYLFGDLKSFLSATDPKTGEMQLQKSEFIKSFSSKSTRRFLEAFLMTQMFDKFIEERENPIKSATVAEGLFEKRLPELMGKKPEIELFSNKKKFPWKKRKTLKQ